MDPSERIIIKSRSSEENVPAIPVIVEDDQSGLPERVAELETEVSELTTEVNNKEDKKTIVKLFEKVLESDSSTIVGFDDVALSGNYEKIIILIQGRCSADNSNIRVNRNGATGLQTIFGNATKAANSRYRIVIEPEKYMNGNGVILDTIVTLEGGNFTKNLMYYYYKTGAAVAMSAINNIMVSLDSATLLTDSNVVVYGVPFPGVEVPAGLRERKLKKGTVDDPEVIAYYENMEK